MRGVCSAWPCTQNYRKENVYVDLVTASLPINEAYNDEYRNQSWIELVEHWYTESKR